MVSAIGQRGEPPNLADADADVSTLTVEPDGKASASFTRLSRVLGSPLPEPVTLGEFWPLIYETMLHAPLGATPQRRAWKAGGP